MPGRLLRDIVNLLLYGGAFIGLCASCLTALTFELLGDVQTHFQYIMLIGTATAALYCAHRVIGLHKLEHITESERFTVVRQYKHHIWLYCLGWIGISFWLFIPLATWSFILWLAPGGAIAFAYVLPFLSKGRRLRDLGWLKIIMIGWSWAWLTTFLPAYYFENVPLLLSAFVSLEILLFIVAITIPFEMRDLTVDRSVGLQTMPMRFGINETLRTGNILCFVIIAMSLIVSIISRDYSYFIAMSMTMLLTMWILKKSLHTGDDYFFSGLTDGLMIIVLVFYWWIPF